MDLSTFFQKFDQFADAPDAVPKMRELIMWSAFSGAFSAEERNLPMPEEWAVEGAPTLPAIPSSWKWQRGNEVFDVIRGVSYKKNDASDGPVEGSFPLLRANNIGNGINFDDLVYVPRENIRDEQFVRRGDILIAMSSGSKKLVGKAAPIATEFNGAFGAFCGIIRNKSAIPDEVLARYFQSPQYTSWVTAAGRGIGINNLGKGDIDSLPIPTPPLAEQKRIVAKVDELMALCDRLEAQQQGRETRRAALARAALARFADAPTPANLHFLFHPSYAIPPADLRKSILTLAVQGKLVPQDPNEGTGDEVLNALQKRNHEKNEKSSSKDEDEDSLPFSIPLSWACARLGQIYESSFYGPRFGKEEYVKEGGIPTIRTTDMTPGGQIVLRDPPRVRVDDPKKMALYEVRPNDLLVTRSGTIGMMAVFKEAYAAIPSAYLIRFRFPPEVMADFYYLFLGSPHGNDLLGLSLRSIGVPNVNATSISKFVAPVPPLAEQRRIVAKVEQLMAMVDALEAQLAASRATAANLLSALVAELTAA